MDQLHRAHDNGRAANAPAQTRDLTEHRAAQFNDRKNMNNAIGEQEAREYTGTGGIRGESGSRSNQVRVCCCRRAREGDREGDSFRVLKQKRR